MKRSTLANSIHFLLKNMGFQRLSSKSRWFRELEDLLLYVELFKGKWGNQMELRTGIILKEHKRIMEERFPYPDVLLPIASLGLPQVRELFDLDSSISQDEHLEMLTRFFEDEVRPVLSKYTSKKDVRSGILTGTIPAGSTRADARALLGL